MISPLTEAFSEFLNKHAYDYHKIAETATPLDSVPLPRAVCRILYIFCKVRDYKVVVRLLPARPQLLEPMLDAFESWSSPIGPQTLDQGFSGVSMIWEERYIMLLWMYHLSGVPFDLASLSSSRLKSLAGRIAPFELPDGCPEIIARLVAVSCCHLSVASREHEAAVKLLSRLALLHDWHKIGLHRTLLGWAFLQLKVRMDKTEAPVDYASLGVLSFLANFVSSATTVLMEPFLNDILELAKEIQPSQSSSAVSTKLMIKLYRNLALHSIDFQNDAVGEATQYFLDQLAAGDTIVRLAASKALAKVVSKLDQDMAMEAFGHVFLELGEDVITMESNANDQSPLDEYLRWGDSRDRCDVRNVNALKWHGLVMTLSHFLYQRSIPPRGLLRPIAQLVNALNFAQKNALGSAIGTNVRDAACFGLWALAKKYTTAEISSVTSDGHCLFQKIANELVVAALLDPIGNIRRAASAALQEMVGRHPNMVDCGQDLELVRTVDYHTVASRQMAMHATLRLMVMRKDYWAWLLRGLLSWRGAMFSDVESRRKLIRETHKYAAKVIRVFAAYHPSGRPTVIPAIIHELRATRFSQISERRGLLWALSDVLQYIEVVGHILPPIQAPLGQEEEMVRRRENQLASIWKILDMGIGPAISRPQAILEVEAKVIAQISKSSLCRESEHTRGRVPLPSSTDAYACFTRLTGSLRRLDDTNAEINGRALKYVCFCLETIYQEVGNWVFELMQYCLEELSSVKGVLRFGFLAALSVTTCSPGRSHWEQKNNQKIIGALVEETASHKLFELKSFSLDLMRQNLIPLDVCSTAMLYAFEECLNDYTMDQRRGDVGSHVRKAAINAVSLAIRRDLVPNPGQRKRLTAKICGLAVEKLDSVRHCAVTALVENWAKCGLSFAQKPYVKAYQLLEVGRGLTPAVVKYHISQTTSLSKL